MLFRIHVFQDQVFHVPEFSRSRFFGVQAFLGSGVSGQGFFQGPGFLGSKFFRVQVQVLNEAVNNNRLGQKL